MFLIPYPGAPSFALTKILADPAGQQTAEYLAGLLIRSTGYRFPTGAQSLFFAAQQVVGSSPDIGSTAAALSAGTVNFT